MFDDQLEALEMRLSQKHLELENRFAKFLGDTT